MASKKHEGSTFGWFFRVRRIERPAEGGRPSFGPRSTSESSNPPRPETPVRPSYSRANSNLQNIKEAITEQQQRPPAITLTSHQGVDDAGIEECLINPPTETRPEARPKVSTDDRYEETEAISDKVSEKKDAFTEAINSNAPNLKSGETQRQKAQADGMTKTQNQNGSDSRDTLLLVEDNLINQKVLRRQLQSRGFEVSITIKEILNSIQFLTSTRSS